MRNDQALELLQALAVTMELVGGRPMSEAAAMAFASNLEEYPHQAVLQALKRCQREVKGNLAPADVIQRIDDGRPGPEEAWALCPKSEDDSAVWTDEISEAYFAAALPLLIEGDRIGARMAFKEAYSARITKARTDKVAPRWWLSGGHDPESRLAVIEAAVTAKRLTQEQALLLLPPGEHRERMEKPQLQALPPPQKERVRQMLATLKLGFKGGVGQ